MRRFLCGMLVLCILFSLCACGAGKIEGKGYKNAKKAARACVEAIADDDVDKVLSTFAMETYVENYDVEKYLDQVGAYLPHTSTPLRPEDDFARSLDLLYRQNTVARALMDMYLTHSLGEAHSGQPIMFESAGYEDAAAFLDKMDSSSWQTVKVGKVRSAEDFIDSQMMGQYQKSVATKKEVLGCEELTDLAVGVALDGTDYYLFMELASYGGKWYVCNFGGSLSTYLGVSALSGGLCLEEDLP